MRSLTISKEIADIIGQARAEQMIAGPYPADYRCTVCHSPGLLDDGVPVAAGLDVYAGGQTVRMHFTHVRCGAGGVRVVDGPLPVLDESIANGILYGHLDSGGQPRAAVVVEVSMTTTAVLTDNEESDQVLAVGLRLGMVPVLDVLTPPVPDRIRWRVQLPRPGHAGGIFGPDRLQLMAPLPPVPSGWLQFAAAGGGQCGLFLASQLGLMGVLDRLRPALDAAARAGRVVGTTAAVVP